MTQKTTDKPKRQNRQYVVELEETGQHRLWYALGTIGGLAIGALVARGLAGLVGRAAGAPERQADVDTVAMPVRDTRLRPAPRRAQRDEAALTALTALEDAVLEALLGDESVRECGIDVGALSRGIVELSGSVWTRADAHRAVAVAQRVPGVETVVNRMDVEEERGRLHPRFDTDDRGFEMSGAEWTGNQVGMGSRRQGRDTDPARTDDSHHQLEDAIDQADRAQFADEGYHHRPRNAERDEVQSTDRQHYREDELDNQSPYGKHAVPQGSQTDGPPQTFNSLSRVGEGLKPGVELNLEAADVPVKPHQHGTPDNERGV